MPTTYAIPDGRTVMAATTYTGTGANQSLSNAVNGVSFQPDFVWFKNRASAYSHLLYDSIRGTSLYLSSNTTGAEVSYALGLTAFNSNGFSVGTDPASNESTKGIVAWQWKAGGTAVSNTSGSITSSVSANTTAGFSVVTYTHNGTNAATVGHGLGVTPSFIINKQRSAAASWRCYHVSLPAGYNIQLNLAQAQSVAGDIFQTAPTSSVFTPGNGDSASGQTMVAYCFAPVAGYSAFGSYTGNGSADGPFVYTGFRPRFLMLKRTDATNQWMMFDTSRSSYNQTSNYLMANLSDTEAATSGSTDTLDFLSNGFKFRCTTTAENASGGTYIYMAFAENPFKYANAR